MIRQRNTRQREVMLELIQGMDYHPTADEVYSLMRREMPRISLGTVYRNLELLSDMGLLQRIDTKPAQRRFDRNCEPHYHARCLSCELVFDAEIAPTDLEQLELRASVTDFEITGYQLEFRGYCSKCSRNRSQQRVLNKDSEEA